MSLPAWIIGSFLFFIALAVVGFAFFELLLAPISHWLYMPMSAFPPGLATTALIESYLLWQIAYQRFKFPAYLVILYSVSLKLFNSITICSMVIALNSNASWKNRTLDYVAERWL